MYRILYNKSIVFDPYGEADEVVIDAKMTNEANAASYLDFTMAPTHPLYNVVAEHEGIVSLYSDGDELFEGVVDSISVNTQGYKSISCVSALDYLNDTVVRNYSTMRGEAELTAPTSVDGYFQWLIDQHNEHVNDERKMFVVGINQGSSFTANNYIYRSSTSNPTTASEISEKILDAFGGYLTLRYENGLKILDLYSDVHEMNTQIIDFGVNLIDFTKKTETKDQYTAVIPKGGTPVFEDGNFDSGTFDKWPSHGKAFITTAMVHSGTHSAYFTEGNGEFINSTFFYAKQGARYKSTVWIKNERSSPIKVYPRYQVFETVSWTNKIAEGVPEYSVPNDGEWHEYTFDFLPNVAERQKIRASWVFDTVANDSLRRVYVDDFNFRRLKNGQDVSEDPITISNVQNGVSNFDSDIYKHGDAVYSISYSEKYGYKEKVYSDTTVFDEETLIKDAIKAVNKLKAPKIGIEAKAVDLSLFMEGYTHLSVGQAVRVRSHPHNVDEYLMVTSIDLDLQDPGRTTYELGASYDTLTGQQSSFIKSLNSSINSSLDAVASLDQTTKDQAIKIGSVTEATKKAQETADSAATKADNAQTVADTAQQTANANKEQISAVKDKQSEQDALIEQAKQGIAASENEIGGINDRMTQMDSDIDKAQSDLETFRTETNTTVQNVMDSVSKTQSDVDAVTDKANTLSSGLDTANTKIAQTSDKVDGLTTTVSNVSSNADSALRLSTQNHQDLASFQTTVQQTYSTKQDTLSQVSSVSQKADAISATLSKDYQKTADSDAKYSTKAELTAASNSITASVSETYATKSVVQALQNIADNAIETWQGHGIPSMTGKPASDWTTSELKKQHSGDMYYDLDTGYSYRFGSEDGTTYSWSKIADSDITKAMQAAAAAQSSADQANAGVSKLNTDIPATYATKSDVKITTDGIKTDVSKAMTLGQTGIDNAATVNQKADGIQATVTQQAQTISDNVKAIAQVNMRADSLSTSISQVSTKTSLALANTQELIINGGFETGDATGWFVDAAYQVVDDMASAHSGRYYLNASSATEIIQRITVPAVPGHVYRFSGWYRRPLTNSSIIGGIRFQKSSDGATYNDWLLTDFGKSEQADWTYFSIDGTIPFDGSTKYVGYRLAFANTTGVVQHFDDLSFKDITEAQAAKKAADDAQSTANTAVSQVSTLSQDLSGFKTSVSQTYETKDASAAKATTAQQNLEGFKTSVSSTYATKTALDTTNGNVTQAQATGDQAIFAALPSMADKTRPDSWLCAIFPTGKGSVETLPSYSLIASLAASDTKYSADSGNIINGIGVDYHYGLIRTLVSFNADTKWTFTCTHDDGSRIYVDGAVVFENAKYTQNDPVTITFTKGNHIVDIMWSNSMGGYGVWGFSVPLSSIATTMYAPAGASVIAETYSTKSYVDQTARTVSLGVVEEYKNGQHGSALATASDISVAKDSITSTVSQTYATKSALGDTNNNVRNAKNAADLALANAQNMVKNTGNDLANTWGNNGVTAENGVYTRTFPGNENHADFLWGGLSGKAIPGHTYSISFDARVDSGDYVSGDYFVFGWTNDWAATQARPLSGDWQRFSGNTTVGGDGTDAPSFFMSSYMTSAGSKVVQFRNLSIKDVTEVAQLQSDVAETYATQSLVQQTATQITSKVEAKYATKDALSQTDSKVDQKADEWSVQLSTISSRADAITSTANDLSDQLATTNSNVDNINGTLSDEISSRQAYMRFSQEADGDPALELGASSSPNKVVLTNDRLSFKSNDAEVAYVGNDQMNINNANVTRTLRIGNFMFAPRADGHLTLTRI